MSTRSSPSPPLTLLGASLPNTPNQASHNHKHKSIHFDQPQNHDTTPIPPLITISYFSTDPYSSDFDNGVGNTVTVRSSTYGNAITTTNHQRAARPLLSEKRFAKHKQGNIARLRIIDEEGASSSSSVDDDKDNNNDKEKTSTVSTPQITTQTMPATRLCRIYDTSIVAKVVDVVGAMKDSVIRAIRNDARNLIAKERAERDKVKDREGVKVVRMKDCVRSM